MPHCSPQQVTIRRCKDAVYLEVAHAVVQWEGGQMGPRQVDWAWRVGMLDKPLQSEVEV